MNCKHCNEKEYCTLFDKKVNQNSCKNCVMKLDNGKDLFEALFKGFTNNKKV